MFPHPRNEALRAQVASPHSHPFPRGPAVPSSRLPRPAPPHLPCPGGEAAGPFVVRSSGGGCTGTGGGERTGQRRLRAGERAGPAAGGPAGRAGGVRRGREGGTGAGEEELGTGPGDGQGLGAAAGPAAEGSGVSAGCQLGSVSPRPLPLSPGGRPSWPGPAPPRGPACAGRTMRLHVCAATLKGKRAGSAPFLPPSPTCTCSPHPPARWAGVRRSTRGTARVYTVPWENRLAFFVPYVKNCFVLT